MKDIIEIVSLKPQGQKQPGDTQPGLQVPLGSKRSNLKNIEKEAKNWPRFLLGHF